LTLQKINVLTLHKKIHFLYKKKKKNPVSFTGQSFNAVYGSPNVCYDNDIKCNLIKLASFLTEMYEDF
jgi:hypothetical protein